MHHDEKEPQPSSSATDTQHPAAAAPQVTSPVPVPPGWVVSRPGEADVPDLVDLLRRHELAARGGSGASTDVVHADVVGDGAEMREHVLVRDPDGRARAWGAVQDRAAGRVMADVTVDPDLDDAVADALGGALYEWAEQVAVRIGRERGLDTTQLDCGAFASDPRQQRWLEDAGLVQVRSWWQMKRPVDPSEAEPGAFPPLADGVVIRRVARGADGMPQEDDLRAVHDVLEGAFADHFNSKPETFDEFLTRLRADAGHRWDHWWLAEVTDERGDLEPAGALVATVSRGEDGEPDSSYVSYIGVLQNARGRGVAKALLHTVIADAARRGRKAVGLEVDADSPTGADRLYTGLGWVTYTTTQSWHTDLAVQEEYPQAG
ncbi:GNAT family N-acetyltransferase [Thalassiella azotivora]